MTDDNTKKRRYWPWVLLGTLVVMVGGCMAMISAVDDAIDESIELSEERDAEALTQVTCKVIGVDGLSDVDVELTADNTTSERSDFFVEFEILDDGTFIGDGFGTLTNVPSETSVTESGFSAVDAPEDMSNVTCNVIDVDRYAST